MLTVEWVVCCRTSNSQHLNEIVVSGCFCTMGESAGRNIWEVLGSAGAACSDSPTSGAARSVADNDALTMSS